MQGLPIEDFLQSADAFTVGNDTADELSPDHFEQAVLDELEKLRNPRNSWVTTILLLAISLALFVMLGMKDSPISFVVLLVVALLVHELGHYLGMQIFGYRNVRMFFIPFFGAAVSGHNRGAKGYQEAIVTLMGPLPGLMLAATLLVVAIVPILSPELRLEIVRVAVLFGFLNAFNLLPVYPLDGGRLLQQILFSRNRYLESAFQIAAGIALVAYGVLNGRSGILMYLGIAMLIGVNAVFKTSTVIQKVRAELGQPSVPMDGLISLPHLRTVLKLIRWHMPSTRTPKATATVVFRVWERWHVQPPGFVATALLLLAYLFGIALTLPWVLALLKGARHG